MRSKPTRVLLSLSVSFLGVGCASTDLSPPPAAVFALFDPAGSPPVLPLPNDIAMVPAQPSTPTVTTFSGPLDPTSVRADDVIAIDLATLSPLLVAPSFDPATNRLLIAPPGNGWPVGRVAIALRGGATGLHGASAEPVVATPAFYFARLPLPIAGCTAPAPGCASATPVLTTEQAIGLERLRQAYAPLLAGLEARGVARDDVVLVWTFTVSPAT